MQKTKTTRIYPDCISNQIGFVAFLLANDHGMEMSDAEIWWAVYNDAGRNFEIAEQMVSELGGNPVALSEFAASLVRFKSGSVQPLIVHDNGRTQFVAICFGLLGLCVGLMVGAIL